MRQTKRHIITRHSDSPMSWLLLSLLLLCLTACSSSDDALPAAPTEPTPSGIQPGNGTKLYIYVYTPQKASPTRATYDGDVSAVDSESSIYTMHFWVFTHMSHQLIGYYAPTEAPGLSAESPYELFQLTIDETYAATEAASRETVDVYVVANVTPETCNLTLNESTTQTELENALMSKDGNLDPFGVTNPATRVPVSIGLPMSGVLRNQSVSGDAPVLRLGDGTEVATLKLYRAVSKLRFAFSKQTGSETLSINSITLSSGMIPLSEYVFMTDADPYDRHTCHIKTDNGYDTTTPLPNLLEAPITDVAENDNPAYYAWGTRELDPAQYEGHIEAGVETGALTQRLCYLRESDQHLQGEIKYQIGDGEEQTATFQMVDDGGFSRNHVWTVYAYQAQARLKVVVVDVTPWKQTETNNEFYNW